MSIILNGTTGITTPDVTSDGLTVDSTTLVVDEANNRVGIGTSSPNSLLHVSSAGSTVLNVEATGANDSRVRITAGNANISYVEFADPDDSDTGEIRYNHITNYMGFHTNGNVERMRIDSSGNVGIGTSSPAQKLHVYNGNLMLESDSGAGNIWTYYKNVDRTYLVGIRGSSNDALSFYDLTADAERARIDSSGNLLVGKTSFETTTVGHALGNNESAIFVRDGTVVVVNRPTTDGTLIGLRQANVQEGTISVSGTTVSYNGGHLSRWAQTTTAKDDTLVKGTVLSNLDEMNVYVAPTTYWTEEDELPEGVSVGDVKVETHTVENEQLNKVKVSDVEGDANVAGVFVNWDYDEAHNVDEINMAMTGDMIIRIAAGTTVARGDLLMSAGDGTAKPQGDDIVRSKTIAKVTSTNVTCTYEDGSFCVPCVLMAC